MIKKIAALLVSLALTALVTGAPANGQSMGSNDPAYQTLTGGNVYVDPAVTGVDQSQLEAAAQQSNDSPHTIVKIAVLGRLPDSYTDSAVYAHILGQELGLGKNALIVAVQRGPGKGITVVTDQLSHQDVLTLENNAVPEIRQNATFGLSDLAQKVAGAINNKEYSSSTTLWVVFLLVIIVVGGLIFSASRRRKQDMAALRGPVQALRDNVLSGIEYLDNYADVLPKNNPDSDQVRLFRQQASNKFDQAVKILSNATESSDLIRAQGLLDRAQADVAQGRRYLDRATGGTGTIPGDDALRPQPLPGTQQDVSAIPASQRGVSFFSSQPAPLGSLVPVTVTINGQSRQVLATPEEADELRQGRMPQVRSFQVNGQTVPWYGYQQYDPYRDYWGYQNSGWGGFGTGVAAGWIGAELLDSLFAPRYFSPGYSPYAFSTDHGYYQGYADNMGGWGNGGGYDGGNFANDATYVNDGNFGNDGNFANAGNLGGTEQYDDATSVNFGNDNSSAWGDNSSFGGADNSGGDFGGGGDAGGGGDFGGGGGDW
jgi:hypothetical protein